MLAHIVEHKRNKRKIDINTQYYVTLLSQNRCMRGKVLKKTADVAHGKRVGWIWSNATLQWDATDSTKLWR